jgi:hypothetical protein
MENGDALRNTLRAAGFEGKSDPGREAVLRFGPEARGGDDDATQSASLPAGRQSLGHLPDRGDDRDSIFAKDGDDQAFRVCSGAISVGFCFRLYHSCPLTSHFKVPV